MSATITRTRHAIQAADSHTLIAYSHRSTGTPAAQLVIAPGMAVGQHFYRDFAEYMAGLGHQVWTYDYRGMHESTAGPMRECTADLSDWYRLDTDTMVRHAHQAGGGAPVFLIGHSFGGQTAPLLPSAGLLSGLVNIAVGSGATHHNQPATRRKAPLLWYVLVPLLSPLFGYFPGRRIGVIGDVPRRAMAQWRRWCLDPSYLLDAETGARDAYARARYPVLALTFRDDELLLEAGSRMMHDAYTGTEVDYHELAPAQFGVPRIGHFGFFRQSHGAPVWPLVSAWLGKRVASLAATRHMPVQKKLAVP